jgi:hypothetical protein
MRINARIKLLAMLLVTAIIVDIPVWILSSIFNNFSDIWFLIIILYLLVAIIVSISGGYLLTRNLSFFKPTKLGIEMAILSYSLLIIVNIFLGFESWMDGIIIIGFIVGFITGARITEIGRRLENK